MAACNSLPGLAVFTKIDANKTTHNTIQYTRVENYENYPKTVNSKWNINNDPQICLDFMQMYAGSAFYSILRGIG